MSERLRLWFLTDVTYYIEKYLLSSFMLYYALKNILLMVREINILASQSGAPESFSYYSLTRYALFFIFNAFNGGLLLRSKRPQQAPRNWKDIVIPVLSSYFMLAYNFTDNMPQWMTVNYAPQPLLFALLLISCALILCGQIVSLIAVFYLRRSFAIFIQFRDLIAHGPYKYIRHPMYTGYTILTLGVLLANVCIAYALISAMHIGLLVYRARLEENILAANDPAYKKHIKCTGFLFPKLSAFTTRQPLLSPGQES